MEDLTKNSNFSPRKKKVKDLMRKEKEKKEQIPPQSVYYSLPDKYYKFEITSKNKELMKFKNDILAYFRDRDNFYLEKLKELKAQADITDKNLDNLSDSTSKNLNTFLINQAEINTKLDKVKAFDAFVNKANDKLISHEIRINCVREDLTKTIQKYDKIYLENLEVPGYIGRCSKYANCKIFFTEMIKEMDKFNTYREKNTIDLCTYKERLENIIKTFQSLVDNNNDSQIKYITKLNDKTNKNLLETLEEKISNVRVDNSKFAIDLINKATELKEVYDKMNKMKDSILKEFNIKAEEFNKKIDETNKSFDDYKVEYATIRKKFLELSDFIKSGRFSRNFGSIFGKKEINSISKKLVKETRESIDAKDVKLLDNIEDIEKIEFKQKCNIDLKSKNNKINYVNNNSTNNVNNKENKENNNINRFSKSQNNFYINNNVGKKKMYGFDQNNNNNNNHKNNDKIEKNRNSVENHNNVMKVHQGILFYLGNNNGDNSSKNANKNNLIKEKEINIKQIKNSIIPIENKEIPIQNMVNEPKSKNNEDLLDIKISKVQKEEKKSSLAEELSMSESYISNINNSINTFSTTNDKNNSINTLINLNNNKCNKFNLFEEELQHNDKIIKELESELEQSTAKVNKLASNKKEIEDNFKSICNKIQPLNLKLNNNPPLEKIPECKEKDKYNVTNKSEQNTTLISNNINNLNNTNNSHHTNENLNKTNCTMAKKSKFKENVDPNEKKDENNVTSKSNKSKYINKNTTNENLLNDTINFSIDKKMNVYDKKLGDLESFTKEQIFELIKQINIIKKSYSYLTNIIKKENSSNSKISNGCNTNHNIFDTSHGSGSFSTNNNNNNENQNNLNLTGNNFYKKPLKSDIIKFGSNKKIIQTMDDINFSDNLFYNGKYYFNIKDIFEKNRNSLNLNLENKRLLKQIDNKFLEENAGRNRSNSSSNKNIHFKSNNTSLAGAIDNKWVDLKKLGNKTTKYNKKQKPQSGVYPCPLLVSGEK